MTKFNMDMWKYFAITHRDHLLCNPISSEKMDELLGLLDLQPGARVLDIACGKGEVLVRLAENWCINGVGVDLSPPFIEDAKRRHTQRVQYTDIEFLLMDGKDYQPVQTESFDVAMCLGATWIWNGYRGTLRALKEFVKPGGLVVCGEPYWISHPPQEYLEIQNMLEDEFNSHHGNVLTGEEEGLNLLSAMVSNHDDWDKYEGLQWRAAANHIRDNPNDPDLPEITGRVRTSREAYLQWGRDVLGWAIYLFRKPRGSTS